MNKKTDLDEKTKNESSYYQNIEIFEPIAKAHVDSEPLSDLIFNDDLIITYSFSGTLKFFKKK